MKDPVFTETILRWYAANGRDLPWRRTRDPYAVWLSEIILQQTRIAQGTAYWERFMEAFPTVEALAAASEDEVLRLWQGLGYYSRARNLHAAARQVVAGGGFPHTYEGLLALRGVGSYTAAAIGSIAFNLPSAVLDGNVYRVLARYFGIAIPVGTTRAAHAFQSLADSLLPEREAGTFNQGIMDFGALVCTPVSPGCDGCPLRDGCDAHRTGRTDRLPVRKNAPAVRTRHLSFIYVRHAGQTAIRRRGPGDIWQGLWEPLVFEDVSADGLPEGAVLLEEGVIHVLTHQRLVTDFYLLEPARRPDLPEGYRWIRESELGRYGKPRLFERLLEAVRKATREDGATQA